MNTSRTLMLSAILVMVSSGLTLAAEPPLGSTTQEATTSSSTPSAPSPQTGQSLGKIDARAQQIKQVLNLTGEQQAAWQKFEDTWREQAKALQVQHQQVRTDSPVTAPERLQRQIALMEQKLAAMKAISVSQQALYEVLTPQQRQIMDAQAPGTGPGPRPETGAR